MPRPIIDLTGQKFNMLTAVRLAKISSAGQSYWIFRCDCGVEKEIRSSHAKSGMIKSCGCSTSRLMSENGSRHGHLKGDVSTPEYAAWSTARARCHQPNNQSYPSYGARGIAMCDRWRFGEGNKSGFECFIADMGKRPSDAHSLDRADNDKGYSPDNCRWATKIEQMRNTRGLRVVEYGGRSMCVSEAIEAAGGVIEIDRVVKRLNRGWSVEEAVTTPSLKRGGRR